MKLFYYQIKITIIFYLHYYYINDYNITTYTITKDLAIYSSIKMFKKKVLLTLMTLKQVY